MTGQWLTIEPVWYTWQRYHVVNSGEERWSAQLRFKGSVTPIVDGVSLSEAMVACEEHAEREAMERRARGNGDYASLKLTHVFRFGDWVLDIGTSPKGRWTVELSCDGFRPQRFEFRSESEACEYARRFGS